MKGTEVNEIRKKINGSNRNVVNNITYVILFSRLCCLIFRSIIEAKNQNDCYKKSYLDAKSQHNLQWKKF